MGNIILDAFDADILRKHYGTTDDTLLPGGAKWYPSRDMVGGYAEDGRDIEIVKIDIIKLRGAGLHA